jgi:hypothetical protein
VYYSMAAMHACFRKRLFSTHSPGANALKKVTLLATWRTR